ncbi:unnamed protein product, partial [Mesorhabditis spiculigera]
MIVLAWSFISSVIEFQRRRRLKACLDAFFRDPANQGRMLLFRNIEEPSISAASTSNFLDTPGVLVKFSSEPFLNRNSPRVIYANETKEIVVVPAEELNAAEWRFCQFNSPYSSTDSLDAMRIFFLASMQPTKQKLDADNLPEALLLNSTCSRAAFSARKTGDGLFCCALEDFVDVAYAWSIDALRESANSPLVLSLKTYSLEEPEVTMTRSTCSALVSKRESNASSFLSFLPQQRAMPILEQLFWGDQFGFNGSIKQRFMSEGALNGDFPLTSYRNQSLPPYLRQLEHEKEAAKIYLEKQRAKRSLDSETESCSTLTPEETEPCSTTRADQVVPSAVHPTTIKILTEPINSSLDTLENLEHYAEHRIDTRIIEEDFHFIDSDSTSCSMDETPRSALLLNQEPNGRPKINPSKNSKSVDYEHYGATTTPLNTPRPETPSGFSLSSGRYRGPQRSPLLEMARKMSLRDDDKDPIDPQLQKLTTFELLKRRRHSYMPQMSDDELDGEHRFHSRGFSIFGSGRDSFRKELFAAPPRRMSTSTRSRDPSQERPPQKPPTILVYSGEDRALYRKIRDCLSRFIPADVYTVFNLLPEHFRRQSWIEPSSTCLLIANTSGLDDLAWTRLHQFFNQSGKIIFVCQNKLLASFTSAESPKKQANMLKMAFGDKANFFGKDFENFLKKALKTLSKHNAVHESYQSKDIVGGSKFGVVISKKIDTPLLLYMENSAHRASAVFSDATLDQLLAPDSLIVRDALSRIGIRILEGEGKIPSLTQGYLQMASAAELSKLEQRVLLGEATGSTPRIFLRKTEKIVESPLPAATPELFPVEVISSNAALPSFNSAAYFGALRARRLGKCLVYAPVCTTTMPLCQSLSTAIPGYEGLIVVARQQLAGRGRGGNEFIALPGTAMFTLNCILPKSCRLAENPSLTQHIMATAVAESVHKLAGVDDFPFCLKWPNDFYSGRTNKVGGLLAECKHRDESLEFIIGVGINVSNSRPTICLNDMLPEDHLFEFQVETLIAEIVSRFEELLLEYELGGFEKFKPLYEKYWLHSREEVTLEDGDRVMIKGIDEYGYMSVRSKKSAKVFSISDDGNSFDMMKGMIRLKL